MSLWIAHQSNADVSHQEEIQWRQLLQGEPEGVRMPPREGRFVEPRISYDALSVQLDQKCGMADAGNL
jgi:hypothetical protein